MIGQREVFTPAQNTSLQRLMVSAPKILPPRQPVGAAALLSSPTPDSGSTRSQSPMQTNRTFSCPAEAAALSRSVHKGLACCPRGRVGSAGATPMAFGTKTLAVRSELLCLRWCLLLSSAPQELAVTGHTPRPSPPDTGRGTSDLLPLLSVL